MYMAKTETDGVSRMKKLLNYSVVLFVLTVVLLLIIPLPAALVDVAIILNMSLSMMILDRKSVV